jgi:hypothetical protein
MKSTEPSPSRVEPETVTLALSVVKEVPVDDRAAVLRWARQLLALRGAKVSRVRKAAAALRASSNRAVLASVIRGIHERLTEVGVRSKHLLWDDRNWASRLALGGVTMGVAACHGGTRS